MSPPTIDTPSSPAAPVVCYYPDELAKAVDVLRRHGATGVYLFGSSALVDGLAPVTQPMDLDLAVEGLPPEAFYKAVGDVLLATSVAVDVVDLDRPTYFMSHLRATGRLHRVA